jgi:hypothetical protein
MLFVSYYQKPRKHIESGRALAKRGAFGYTAISIKVVPKQSGKVEYKREWLAGNTDT